MSSPEALEANEEAWWAHWCEVEDEDWAVFYYNPWYDEPVFNHATRINVSQREEDSAVQQIIGRYRVRNLVPHVYVTPFTSSKGLEKALLSHGFTYTDSMLTMKAQSSARRQAPKNGVRVRAAGIGRATLWAEVYLDSFYGDRATLPFVARVVQRLARKKESHLYLAFVGEEASGVAALYHFSGVAGLYCLGTRPRFRGKGVATTLLYHLRLAAERRGEVFSLQTFEGDGLKGFYEGRGLSQVYVKGVYRGPR